MIDFSNIICTNSRVSLQLFDDAVSWERKTTYAFLNLFLFPFFSLFYRGCYSVFTKFFFRNLNGVVVYIS